MILNDKIRLNKESKAEDEANITNNMKTKKKIKITVMLLHV